MKRLLRSLRSRVAVRLVSIVATVAGLGWLMLALAGFFTRKVPLVDSSPQRVPIPHTRVGEVRLVQQPRSETAVGSVRPVHEAAVASKLLARVAEVRVTAGQAVRQGDLLVQLDDENLRTRVKQAEAALAAAQATLERAVSEHTRAQTLLEKNAVARAEFDQAVAAKKTAEAELQRARQALEEANITLEYAAVRAPLSGIVIEKRISVGDTATPGQVLLTLYEPNRMQLVTTVRESLALRLKVGDQVRARLDVLDHDCLATVSEVVPQAESASRSFTVKVTGPCPPGIYSGMFGRISIPLEDEPVLIVPAAAIVRVGQLELADVIQHGVVQRRAVRVGRQGDAGYEVLTGLRAGDQVVLHSAGEVKP